MLSVALCGQWKACTKVQCDNGLLSAWPNTISLRSLKKALESGIPPPGTIREMKGWEGGCATWSLIGIDENKEANTQMFGSQLAWLPWLEYYTALNDTTGEFVTPGKMLTVDC